MEDEELAARAAAGARDSFEALVRRHGSRLLAVIEHHAGDHHQALDLAQEVWVKVYRALGRFRAGAAFRPWLFSIALNHVRDAHRKRGRSKLVYMQDYKKTPRSFDPGPQREARDAVAAAVERVPEPYRSALSLVDLGGLTYEEAADALECAVGTVKSRVNRARFLFRDQYLKSSGEAETLTPAPPVTSGTPGSRRHPAQHSGGHA